MRVSWGDLEGTVHESFTSWLESKDCTLQAATDAKEAMIYG